MYRVLGGRNNQNKKRAVITVSVAMKVVVVVAVVDGDNMVPTNQVNVSLWAAMHFRVAATR